MSVMLKKCKTEEIKDTAELWSIELGDSTTVPHALLISGLT